MKLPEDLFFSKTHEWVRYEQDGTAFIGLTDHAQEALGDVAFINLCDEGESFEFGDVIGDIESIKAVTDVYTPVSGTVTHVNDELLDAPEKINSDPYGSWLVEFEGVARNEELLDAEGYEKFLAETE
ncbi:MAG: glycine cleavage system protein GcvH [Clostridiales bacterium]|nr:glycine cleavage system protein GcvH [Clostridiales bacterium]